MTNVLERPFREEFPGKKTPFILGIAQIGRRAAQMDFDTSNCVQEDGSNLPKRKNVFLGSILFEVFDNQTKLNQIIFCK